MNTAEAQVDPTLSSHTPLPLVRGIGKLEEEEIVDLLGHTEEGSQDPKNTEKLLGTTENPPAKKGRSVIFFLQHSEPARHSFVLLQKWQGTVLEVQTDTFIARLEDLTQANPQEEAEFLVDEISEDDHDLIVPGAIFYWHRGRQRRGGADRQSHRVEIDKAPTSNEAEISIFSPGRGEIIVSLWSPRVMN